MDVDGAEPNEAEPEELRTLSVLARASFGDGGEVRVESTPAGLALRLAALGDSAVGLEPIASLQGPAKLSLYMGPRCRHAAAGRSRVLALWTGEQADCSTRPGASAVVRGIPPGSACAVSNAPAGQWSLEVYRCGRLGEPAATLTFELPIDAGPNGRAEVGGQDANLRD